MTRSLLVLLWPLALAFAIALLADVRSWWQTAPAEVREAVACVRYSLLSRDGRRRVLRAIARESRRLASIAWDRTQEILDRIRTHQIGPEYDRWRESYWEAKRIVRAKRRQLAFTSEVYNSVGVHTDIAGGAAANDTVFNAPLGQLDQALLNKSYDLKAQGTCLMDGVTNETAKLTTAIDAMAAQGGGIVWAPAGTLLHDTVVLKTGVWIAAASCSATTFKQVSDVGGHHMITLAANAVNCGILNIGFVGVGGVGGNTFGFIAGGNGNNSRIRVENCNFSGFSGSGVQMGAPGGLVSDFKIIGGSWIDNAVNIGQPPGIALTNAYRGEIQSPYIEKSTADRAFNGANFGIDLEPNVDADVIQDIIISGARIRNTGAGGIQVLARATAPNQTKNIAIQTPTIWACQGDGLLIGQNGAKGTIISNPDIHDNSRFGVRFYGSDSVMSGGRIVDNNQAASATGHVSVEAGVLNTTISNTRIGYVQFAGASIPAVIEQGGGSDWTQVSGCNVRTFSGTVNFTFTGANSSALNCPGWNVIVSELNKHSFHYEPIGFAGINIVNVNTGSTVAVAAGRGTSMATSATNPSSTSQRAHTAGSGGVGGKLVSRIRRIEFQGYLADVFANSNAFWYMTDENIDTIPTAIVRHLGVKNLNGVVSFTTADGATEQVTDITAFVTQAVEHNIVITFDGVTARCFISGVLRATHSTNVPAGAGTTGAVFHAFINNNASANVRTMLFYSVDVIFANS